MNDQHAHAGYPAHDGYQNGSFNSDPLFGNLPGGYEDPAAPTGTYDSAQWNAGAPEAAGYDAYAAPQYTATATYDPAATYHATGTYEATAQWDANAWNQANPQQQMNPLNGADPSGQFTTAPFGYDAQGHPATAQFDAGQLQAEQPYGYDATALWVAPAYDTGAYDATAWNSPETPYQGETPYQQAEEHYRPETAYDAEAGYGHEAPYESAETPEGRPEQPAPADDPYDGLDAYGDERSDAADDDTDSGTDAEEAPRAVHMAETMTAPAVLLTPRPVGRSAGGSNGGRGRRRTPAKRSALLTVAVPSACVMGVAGIAAASVGGLAAEEKQDDTITTQAADVGSAKKIAAANAKVDSQVVAMNADARDFGDRASRTQERIDLKARQAAEKQKRAEDEARKEALRPKFALPVSQHGLSAYFGQAGVNWMSVHTGIDFPVAYGTPVMAATDGTVRTQYNTAYGNMAIVTSPDGTETWYCHLSSTKIRSGSVKAGDVIAFSGNSGNSTGPHLHFEVRPGAGAAINPLPWLQSHGLDPQ